MSRGVVSVLRSYTALAGAVSVLKTAGYTLDAERDDEDGRIDRLVWTLNHEAVVGLPPRVQATVVGRDYPYRTIVAEAF